MTPRQSSKPAIPRRSPTVESAAERARERAAARRRPLFGYEDYYEITPAGLLYSKGLGRSIQQRGGGGEAVSYLAFEIDGTEFRLSAWEAIVRSFLTDAQIGEILAALPDDVIDAADTGDDDELIETLKDQKRALDALAQTYGVTGRAVFGLALSRLGRRTWAPYLTLAEVQAQNGANRRDSPAK